MRGTRALPVATSENIAISAPRQILRLRTFGWLWLLALVPRLAVALVFLSYPIALDDMQQYDMLARSLAGGHGYRWYSAADVQAIRPYLQQFLNLDNLPLTAEGMETTFRPPGYPFFLAALYKLVPLEQRFAYARIVQAVLLALLAPCAALLALEFGARRRVAIASGIVMALYPMLWFYPVALASEDLFIPLVLFAVLALAALRRSPRLRQAALAGLLLGMAMLTRSIIAPFAVLGAIWAGWVTRSWRYAVVILAAAFGLTLPWAVRNSILMGKPSFVETGLSYQMYIGYHPQGDGSFISSIAIQPLSIFDDAARERYSTQQVVSFIKANPIGEALRVFPRAAYFVAAEDRELSYFYSNGWLGTIPEPWLLLAYLAIVLPWMVVASGSVLGGLLAPRRELAWLALLLVVGYTLPHLLVIAEPRFHMTLVPVMVPLACIGWAQGREGWRRMISGRSWPVWLARLSLLALVALWVWSFAMRWGRLVALLSPGGSSLRLYY